MSLSCGKNAWDHSTYDQWPEVSNGRETRGSFATHSGHCSMKLSSVSIGNVRENQSIVSFFTALDQPECIGCRQPNEFDLRPWFSFGCLSSFRKRECFGALLRLPSAIKDAEN